MMRSCRFQYIDGHVGQKVQSRWAHMHVLIYLERL